MSAPFASPCGHGRCTSRFWDVVQRSGISTAEIYRLIESGYEARAELTYGLVYIILAKGADVVHWESTAGDAGFFTRDFNNRVHNLSPKLDNLGSEEIRRKLEGNS